MLKYLTIFLTMSFLLTSCSLSQLDTLLEAMTTTNSDSSSSSQSYEANISDALFTTILDAIEKKDADAIKALFSERALKEAEDIDASIEYLFNLFDGEVASWERGALSSDGSFRYGKLSNQIHTLGISYIPRMENTGFCF